MRVLIISGGKGGTGKTTITCNSAVSLAKRGLRVGVLDADFHSPSCHHLLKPITSVEEDCERMRIKPANTDRGISLFSTALLFPESCGISWLGEDVRHALYMMCNQVDWNCDWLVVDTPPGTSDELDIILQELKRYPLKAVMVTIPTELAYAAAARCYDLLKSLNVEVSCLVENFSDVFSFNLNPVWSENIPVVKVPYMPILNSDVVVEECFDRIVELVM